MLGPTGARPSTAGSPRRLPSWALVFALALLLRVAVVLLTRDLGIGLDDMFQYDMLARSLALGNGFRWYAPDDAAQIAPYLGMSVEELAPDDRGMLTTFRAPLYPAFLALVYLLAGVGPERFFFARLVQALLGALLAPLTYFTAVRLLRRMPWDKALSVRVGSISGSIVAVYPLLVAYPLALATENVFFPLTMAAVLALLALDRPGREGIAPQRAPFNDAQIALGAGALLGLAALTRSVILPFALAGLGWVWFGLKRPQVVLIGLAALLLTVAPWIVRNSLLEGRPTGIETSMGYNLYLGYHPQSSGTFLFGPSLDLLKIQDDATRDRVGTERALEFIREDPLRFPYLALRRLGHTFDLEWRAFIYFYSNGLLGGIAPPMLILILLMLALPLIVVSLSAPFGAAMLPMSPAAGLLALFVASYLLPHILILSEERFHLLLVPYLAILGSVAWMGRPRPLPLRRRYLIPAVLALLLIANWAAQIAGMSPVLWQLLGPQGSQLHLSY